MMRPLVAVNISCVLIASGYVIDSACAGRVLTPGTAAEVSISGEKLEEGVGLFRRAVDEDELRGVVLLVARNGKIVLHEALGWRNKEEELPMERDTLFRMASNTKPAVAAAVLMLAKEGKLALDDKIGKHLPAFDNQAYEGVEIRHLLSHTSGMRISTLFVKPLMKPSAEHPGAPTLQLEVNRFAAIAPEEKPGTTYSYNNPGYNTLGALVEVCSGMPLEEFLTERIYRPLGMVDTTNHPLPEKVERMSVVYKRTGSSWKVLFEQDTTTKVPFVRGSGGMVSSAVDYARFCQMFLNQGEYGGKRLLSADSVALATSPQTDPTGKDNGSRNGKKYYGYGWAVSEDGTFSHGGSEGTFAWVDPDRGVVGLVLTQSPGGKLLRGEFMEAVSAACR